MAAAARTRRGGADGGRPGGGAASWHGGGEPGGGQTPSYTLDVLTSVKALGHTWSLSLFEDAGVFVELGTTNNGVTEDHDWSSAAGFAATAAKDLKVTSTGHATFKTGTALNPVPGVSLSFTPAKATKKTCSTGSDTTYSGKVSGTLSLATGLHGGVKIHVKFSAHPGATFDVDRSCVIKNTGKNICQGGSWFLSGAKLLGGSLLGVQILGAKPAWLDDFSRGELKTASKWLTRTVSVMSMAPRPS